MVRSLKLLAGLALVVCLCLAVVKAGPAQSSSDPSAGNRSQGQSGSQSNPPASAPSKSQPNSKPAPDDLPKSAPPLARDPYDDTRPYVPPGAAKSVEIAHYYFIKKDYKAALSRYMEAVGTNPDYPPAYLGLAKCEDKLGFKKQALANYRKYLNELPSDKDAENAKGVQKAIRRLEQQLGKGMPAAERRR